jgi:serine/threonine-protein kinase
MPRDQTTDGPRQSGNDLTPDDQRAVLAIVDLALDVPEDEREQLIERMAPGNVAMRRAVVRLVASCDAADSQSVFLRGDAAGYALPVITDIAAYDRLAQQRLFTELSRALAERYTVEREVARGGMSTVYLARDERHHREVAIKVMHSELTHGAGVQRFLREISIASMVRHPHILPLYDSGEVNGQLFYVMPYVEGGSLGGRLEQRRQLPVAEAIAITRDVAEALDYAHSCGVVHRDIKPQNILLDRDHAVVADFGVARAIAAAAGDRVTESGIAVGTPRYMSPEQAAGENELDARSDVYSLGCVVYEMLAGEPPFTGATRQEILGKHALGSVPRLKLARPSAAPGTQAVLERALAKRPADRYATAGQFVQALENDTSARPMGWGRRIAVAGVAIAVVAGAATTFVRARRDGAARTTVAPRAVTPTPPDPKRIAVLYLDDLSPGQTLGHVAAGLTEDLIDELNQVSGLRVISPNGVRPFRDKSPPVDSLARSLDVGTLVAGSVNTSGGRLRVTVRLISTPRGDQMVSRTLTYPWEDLLVLEEKLSGEVALLLRSNLGQDIRLRRLRAEARSVAAWEGVQRGDELARQGSALVRTGDNVAATAALLRADSLFQVAERQDGQWLIPTIARGWNASALAYMAPGADQLSAARLLEGLAHAERALSRNARDAEALALRGDLRYRLATFTTVPNADSILRLAELDLQAAVQQRPDLARAWYTLGELYYRTVRYADATRAARTAFEADAFLTEIRSVVAVLFVSALHQERFDEARSWCDLARKRYADDVRFVECELRMIGWSGRGARDVTSAWREIRTVEASLPTSMIPINWAYRRFMVTAVLARSGMQDSARAVLRRVRAEQDTQRSIAALPQVEAYVRALLGESDEAIRLLERYVESGASARAYVATNPWYRSLRSDARFQRLVQRR